MQQVVRKLVALQPEFQKFLDSAPDAIVIVDRDASIVFSNEQAAEMFGYRREELLGQPVELLVPEALRKKLLSKREAYFEHPHLRPMGAMELQARRKDGSIFPVEISLAPFENEGGLLVTSAIRDVTGRKQAEEALRRAIVAVPEAEWKPYPKSTEEEIRECADVPFVPGEKSEHKASQPLRYVAVRVCKQQGELFADGSAVRHFAVLSNLWEWKPEKLIAWHREKAGTVEMVHDVLKNELAAGVLPSKYFGANAAWLRLAAITHNVLVALKRLALPADMLSARPKRLRFVYLCTAGHIIRHARKILLLLAAVRERIWVWVEMGQLLPLRA